MLAYNESSIPGTTLAERLSLALAENLALEVANTSDCQVELYQGLKVVTVQAYKMHEFHPLHPETAVRQAAFSHVQETLELAARLNAPRILTVCGFGFEIIDRPLECCLEFFHSLVPIAKSLGIRMMIEPLSPLRAGAFTDPKDPKDVIKLMAMLNEPSVFGLAIDTGHLLDSGINLNDFFLNWQFPIEELQLKGARSTPPDPTIPLTVWLENLPQIPNVICVEHRQSISLPNFRELINWVRRSQLANDIFG
ncbi:sugar phosphate isomerase/epimerase family protein [Aerosakkonemataceae cyanobacterium BLCC-F154]|uniref:Sugar phosphate isomerase/epimerase family protein n=1 Tax=Floridaenema fluviatile BLCC-F154 TaxID=3153640 RepID=A0ABV4YBA5_9CYAN